HGDGLRLLGADADLVVLDQVAVEAVLPELVADRGTAAVTTEVEAEDGEALLGQFFRQQVPAFLVAALAAELVQEDDARRLAPLASRPEGAVQGHLIHRLEAGPLGLLLLVLGAGSGQFTGHEQADREPEGKGKRELSHVQTLRKVT